MKEYKSKTGGRPLYNEDIQNLQELSLSMTEFFNGSKLNFVLSGCEITVRRNGSTTLRSISSGYVYLNGKIRRVEARDIGTAPLPVYICEKDTATGNGIVYADSSSDEQFIDYEAEIRTSQETLSGQYIEASNDESGFPDVKSAFFNYYSLIKDTDLEQYVKSFTTFGTGIKTALVRLLKANSSADISIDANGNFIVQLGTYLNHRYSFVVSKSSGEIGISDNGKSIWSIRVNPDGSLTLPSINTKSIYLSEGMSLQDLLTGKITAQIATISDLHIDPAAGGDMHYGSSSINVSGADEGSWISPFIRFIATQGSKACGMMMRAFGSTLRLVSDYMTVDLRLNNADDRVDFSKGVCAPKIISVGDVYENGKKLSDIYLKKDDANVDSGWVPMINSRTGEPIPTLLVRNRYDITLHIKGTVPRDIWGYVPEKSTNSYCACLGLKLPDSMNVSDLSERQIGNSYYYTPNGYGYNIPTNASNTAAVIEVVPMTPLGMSGHGGDYSPYCILGLKSDRTLYMFGARFSDGCCWNGNSYYFPYASGDVSFEMKTIL